MKITESRLRKIVNDVIRESAVSSNTKNRNLYYGKLEETVLRRVIRQELIREGRKLDALKRWGQRAGMTLGIAGALFGGGSGIQDASARSTDPSATMQQVEDALPGDGLVEFGSTVLSIKEINQLINKLITDFYGEHPEDDMTEKEFFEMNVYSYLLEEQGFSEDEAIDVSSLFADAFHITPDKTKALENAVKQQKKLSSQDEALLTLIKLIDIDVQKAIGGVQPK